MWVFFPLNTHFQASAIHKSEFHFSFKKSQFLVLVIGGESMNAKGTQRKEPTFYYFKVSWFLSQSDDFAGLTHGFLMYATINTRFVMLILVAASSMNFKDF